MHFAAQHVAGVVDKELVRAGVAVAFHHAASGAQHQRQPHIGGGAVEHRGRVAHRDAARSSIGDADVVDAHAVVAHHFHAGQAVEHGSVHCRMAIGVDRVHRLARAVER